MKAKKMTTFTLFILFIIGICYSDVVEEIYAVINDETITHSEFINAQNETTKQMQAKLQGEKLNEALKLMKGKIMNQLIEHKLILSKAKEKKYDVDAEVELILNEIKKQNNMKSDDELKAALQAEGISFADFKEQQKVVRMQQRFIYEEVTSKIIIDNAEILDYYKANMKNFTKPTKISLNCIFLNKDNYINETALLQKRNKIDIELSGEEFEPVAKKHSELSNTDNNIYLGEFKQGELDENIEKAALNLKVKEYSSWIETENGWYIIHLLNKTDASLIEYKEVRDNIKNILLSKKQNIELAKFIKQLKKESYIKIYKNFD